MRRFIVTLALFASLASGAAAQGPGPPAEEYTPRPPATDPIDAIWPGGIDPLAGIEQGIRLPGGAVYLGGGLYYDRASGIYYGNSH